MTRAAVARAISAPPRASAPLAIVGLLAVLLFVVALGGVPTSAAASTGSPTPTPTGSGGSSLTDQQRAAARQEAARKAAAKKATFGIGPANTKGLDGRPYLSILASPGSRLTDYVAVINVAAHSVALNLYVAEAMVGADGAFGYLARSAPRTDAATWITPKTPGHTATITLGPRQRLVVPITITVPANASPGDHAAGVIASLTSHVTSSAGERVDFEQRVALRTFIRVEGPLHPKLSIESLSGRYAGTANPIGTGTVTVRYRVRNTGNVRLGARQSLAVSGLFGTRHPAKGLADIPLLLPGSSVTVTATVPDVFPQVHLTARVRLFPLTVAGDVDPGVPAHFDRITSVWAIPWGLIITIAGLVLLVGLWLVWRQRRRGGRGGNGRHHERKPPPNGPDPVDGFAPVTAGAVEPEPATRAGHQASIQ
ncbi:MAG TPA: hypothetical protein VHS54_05605 [Jatrophihabitans sp.]|jgi:uncharacterized membrane protein|nr:hypothetical protein [Jatrophihabitans sp.]